MSGSLPTYQFVTYFNTPVIDGEVNCIRNQESMYKRMCADAIPYVYVVNQYGTYDITTPFPNLNRKKLILLIKQRFNSVVISDTTAEMLLTQILIDFGAMYPTKSNYKEIILRIEQLYQLTIQLAINPGLLLDVVALQQIATYPIIGQCEPIIGQCVVKLFSIPSRMSRRHQY